MIALDRIHLFTTNAIINIMIFFKHYNFSYLF